MELDNCYFVVEVLLWLLLYLVLFIGDVGFVWYKYFIFFFFFENDIKLFELEWLLNNFEFIRLFICSDNLLS